MKRTALTLTLISALLFSVVAGIELANVVKANAFFMYKWVDPIPGAVPPPIVIFSPQNNSVYSSSDEVAVSFNISQVKLDEWFSSKISVECSLDNRVVELFKLGGWGLQEPRNPKSEFNISFSLSSLSLGNHSLTVKAGCVFRKWVTSEDYVGEIFSIASTSTTFFTITNAPIVTVLSLENKTYETSDVPLNFTVNKPAPVTRIKYSLDGQENVTVTGNTTLTGLSNGLHNVTVYASDTAGNIGASETIHFTVAVTETAPEPFPTTLVIAPISSVAVIGVGLLVYFKKRKH